MESKDAVGVVQGITEKPNGWTDVHVLFTGRQNATKLGIGPDDSHLVDEVRAVGQNAATFSFTEKDGDLNPRSGKPYINRYLNGVVAGVVAGSQSDALGGAASSTAGGSYQEPQPRWTEEEVARFEDKERRDYRSRAWGQTTAAFAHTIKVDEDPVAVFDRLKPFQRKVYEDICGSFAYPTVDDDIPF
jgi:hypothetical protein